MSNSKYKIKDSCDSDKCSFRDVIFDTFSFITCDGCKTEVSKELVEKKARGDVKEEQVYMDGDTPGEWLPGSAPRPKNYDEEDDLFYPYDLFVD